MIWLRPERSGRGPEPTHSRAAIAAAAIGLADAGGLDAVSMRRVAAALGAGTMSLYNYVPKKEHLFDLMLDAAAGEIALPGKPSGDPRADLTLLARETLATMRRHPWLAGLTLTRPSMGPNALRCTEFFLAVLAGSAADGGTKMEMFALLSGFVCQFAEWERTAAGGAAEQWQADLVAYLGTVIATGHYPHLAATLAAGASTPPADADTIFTRSLDRLVRLILDPPADHPAP
ncbi:TetR/AcrR family transcriptional regulator C-terminal domain-containing protein [Frankia sp. CNm7]|uniref:TetR/AcrR family transcriptional regulator C-terminal domain-containing protein n=1 Tax=Frankia nepalensis TaxID=1836974 RepID=A0A937RUM4_9ACTN|nr:TetR/AcrR family transcriptional regulator C-terminal domain-containing protein [Frankia nepalensis]MBL7501892.1 TetR/AcrR family transcriptional regulator C-terminal domain-containing protein [Frankia nepalensis]MBL7511633.1 TetR/AcrR family transcriptional regulator C-terminal domain-containing protein [Frankia nepalensis]MBL7523661.1 TetR/AcrR family transcriptional regulator C-terminal domain-containing protein [Frankia nepalensis]MBL7633624.1 TetR/AcrR family transcriptional regulator C